MRKDYISFVDKSTKSNQNQNNMVVMDDTNGNQKEKIMWLLVIVSVISLCICCTYIVLMYNSLQSIVQSIDNTKHFLTNNSSIGVEKCLNKLLNSVCDNYQYGDMLL